MRWAHHEQSIEGPSSANVELAFCASGSTVMTAVSVAERIKQYRARKADGRKIVTLELRADEIDGLVKAGYLEKAKASESKQIEIALYAYLDDYGPRKDTPLRRNDDRK